MIKRHSGTRIFPKRLVWSERALFILQISEIKFLGNQNRERWDSELNAALLPENVTFHPSVTKPITVRKTNASLFRNIFWWYLSETIIARNYFQKWNLTGSKKKLKVAFWLNTFVCSENWSQLWQLTSSSDICERMLADNYLNIYIYRRVFSLDYI